MEDDVLSRDNPIVEESKDQLDHQITQFKEPKVKLRQLLIGMLNSQHEDSPASSIMKGAKNDMHFVISAEQSQAHMAGS